MKGKTLIQLILAQDPTGEIEVSVDNIDIVAVTKTASSNYGWMQKINSKQDDNGNLLTVEGAELVGSGYRLVLHTLPIQSAIREWGIKDVKIVGADSGGYKRNMVYSWLDSAGVKYETPKKSESVYIQTPRIDRRAAINQAENEFRIDWPNVPQFIIDHIGRNNLEPQPAAVANPVPLPAYVVEDDVMEDEYEDDYDPEDDEDDDLDEDDENLDDGF
jgi:hypothetical protein